MSIRARARRYQGMATIKYVGKNHSQLNAGLHIFPNSEHFVSDIAGFDMVYNQSGLDGPLPLLDC